MATEQELSAQIAKVKRALLDLGDLRPGSISEQYNVCGTAGCRCKADPARRHGPYYQLSYTLGGRSRTEALKSEDLEAARAQIENYKEMRALIEEWVEASIALDRLRRAAALSSRLDARRAGRLRSPCVTNGVTIASRPLVGAAPVAAHAYRSWRDPDS